MGAYLPNVVSSSDFGAHAAAATLEARSFSLARTCTGRVSVHTPCAMELLFKGKLLIDIERHRPAVSDRSKQNGIRKGEGGGDSPQDEPPRRLWSVSEVQRRKMKRLKPILLR